jgi:hypothetical protein
VAQIYATVCGLRVPVTQKPTGYGVGYEYDVGHTSRDIGTYAEVEKKTAKKLAQTFSTTPPRPGHEVQLCEKVWLVRHRSGRFEIDRRASGGLKGRR